MIELKNATKRYGDTTAVEDLSFTVKPGIVTGFLGPNGAGKSTSMRMIVGLDDPTSGEATVNGHHYRSFKAPLHEVGAMLEARSVHTGRPAYQHLLALAQTHGLPSSRVNEVIDQVGLTDVAHRRAGGFSLGMGQRLGIAAALLGDPDTVILDEPTNGLDPDGIRWIRELLKDLARQGRTVFLSSHLMSELSQTVEHVIVIGRGRLIADTSITDLVERASAGAAVTVRTPDAEELRHVLSGPGRWIDAAGHGLLQVQGIPAPEIFTIAAENGIVLHELTPQTATLEDAYMSLTSDAIEYTTPTSNHREEIAA
ncbi:MAG: ABC transporter ATP-binding protein [Solirubrobacteraceae bacterium]